MDKKVTVVGAGNVGATAAQRLVEKELCDVILLDISMPGMDGLDVTKQLKATNPEVRILIVTMHAVAHTVPRHACSTPTPAAVAGHI